MKRLLALCLFLLPLESALAEITVKEAWVRATPPAARTAAVYFTLVNHGEADALVGAESPSADLAELHSHVERDGMIAMRQVKRLALPTEGRAALEPHGDHLMLVSLRRDLAPGDRVSLRLHFEHHPPLDIEVPVRDGRRP